MEAKKGFEMFYGTIPVMNGYAPEAEMANRVHAHHVADKNNYRMYKLTLEERIDIKNAMKKVPERKHEPKKFNQLIKLADS